MYELNLPDLDLGLLSSLKNIGQSVLKVIDNPLTRTGLAASGLSGAGAILSGLAGNQNAANAQLGAFLGSQNSAGPAAQLPTYTTPRQPTMPVYLGSNSLFPTLPGAGTVAKVAKTVARPGGVVGYLYDAAGNIIGTQKKRRRMNPANIRAARRAIRRIRGTRRILQRIERTLPTRTVHTRRK